MITLYLFIIPSIFILIKVILYFIIKKFGKFSYDGFSAAGFAYNSEKDIFYSVKNAWQRNFGYTHMYDVLAPLFQMIIDTEPVRFNYNNKNWLITFWKGQYAMVTGVEVGVYYTKQKKVNKKTVYFPVSDSEMLDMEITLYKNGKFITRVSTKHWWLAVFKLGMFSNPKDLTMYVNITFPNYEMLNAFLKSFKKLGYKSKHYSIIDRTFCFKYQKPRTKQVWTRSWITDTIRQSINRNNIKLYDEYLSNLIDDNKIDDSKTNAEKVIILDKLIPKLLKNNDDNEISKRIINSNKDNIVFINSDIYSKTLVNKQ